MIIAQHNMNLLCLPSCYMQTKYGLNKRNCFAYYETMLWMSNYSEVDLVSITELFCIAYQYKPYNTTVI